MHLRDCHGYKLQADHKLCIADKLSYLEILRTRNFDLTRVERVLAAYTIEQKEVWGTKDAVQHRKGRPGAHG